MTASWSAEQLESVEAAEELEIAPQRADGTLRGWVPIWVVRVGDDVYVRTWLRRETGWFGHVLVTHAARMRVPGVECDVTVEDVGRSSAEVREAIDEAYRSKYGRYGSSTVGRMIGDEAADATLRLVPR